MTQLALDMLPTGAWRLTGARGAACLPLPGAVPSLCAEWCSAVGGRVWLPCDPRPGCEGCAELAAHDDEIRCLRGQIAMLVERVAKERRRTG